MQRRFTQGGTKNVQSVPSPSGSSNCSAICMPETGRTADEERIVTGRETVERVLSADELQQQLVPAMAVESRNCGSWRRSRAKAIREHLIEQGGLSEDRVFLDVDVAASDGQQVSPSQFDGQLDSPSRLGLRLVAHPGAVGRTIRSRWRSTPRK